MSAQVIAFPTPGSWEPYVDEAALARHFGVGERTVRRWRKEGMPSRKLAGSRRYRVTECEAWLVEQANRRDGAA